MTRNARGRPTPSLECLHAHAPRDAPAPTVLRIAAAMRRTALVTPYPSAVVGVPQFRFTRRTPREARRRLRPRSPITRDEIPTVLDVVPAGHRSNNPLHVPHAEEACRTSTLRSRFLLTCDASVFRCHEAVRPHEGVRVVIEVPGVGAARCSLALPAQLPVRTTFSVASSGPHGHTVFNGWRIIGIRVSLPPCRRCAVKRPSWGPPYSRR